MLNRLLGRSLDTKWPELVLPELWAEFRIDERVLQLAARGEPKIKMLRGEMARHLGGEGFVLGKQKLQSLDIEIAILSVGKLGRVEAALLEILVARRALLAIPALLIDQRDRREDREPFDGEWNMRQISNGSMDTSRRRHFKARRISN